MPKTWVLECPELCSLRPGTKLSFLVSDGMVNGVSYRSLIKQAWDDHKVKVYPGTLSRHKKHIVVTGREADVSKPDEGIRANATNIEILETIIQKGFRNSNNWKPTISDTMKAMDMWFRLTQGNPFDDLLNTLASASIGEETEEEDEETNPVAVASLDEVEMAETIEENLEEFAEAGVT